MGIIYVMTNKINGKKYVGQTIRPFNKRLQKHLSLSNKDKPITVISKAIKKYGIDNFNIETHDIMNCCLDDVEKVMIKTLNTKTPNGYNVVDGGNTTYGYHHTEEAKKKMSISSSGDNCSKETRAKMSKSHYKYIYEVITPKGNIEITNNIRGYCRDNNLQQSNMVNVVNGKVKTHKGYKARKLNQIKEEN